MTDLDWLSFGVIVDLPAAVGVFRRQRDGADGVVARPHGCGWRSRAIATRRIVNRLLEQRERLIGALLLGNNAVNIAASSLATGVLLIWFGNAGVVYATVVMTVLVVVFSEVLPKTAAFNAPDRIALIVARPMQWVVRLLGPMLMAIEALVRWLLRLVGMNVGEDQAVLSAHEELRGAVDLLHREGDVEKRRPRHVRRRARSARARSLRRDDPPHQDDHCLRRRQAGGHRQRRDRRRR